MMPTTPVRLALPSQEAAARLDALAVRDGWTGLGQRAASATHAAMESWSMDNGNTSIHRVDDGFLGVQYVVLTGPGAPQLAPRLRTELGAVSLDEAMGTARSLAASPAQRASAIRMLGVLAPPHYDDAVMHVLADALQSGDREMRSTTLEAIAALGWHELSPLVTAVALSDESDALRARATRIAQAFAAAVPRQE